MVVVGVVLVMPLLVEQVEEALLTAHLPPVLLGKAIVAAPVVLTVVRAVQAAGLLVEAAEATAMV